METPCLHVKPGVDLSRLDPGGCRLLAVVAMAPLALGFSLTITCGNEGHGPDDPHTLGKALDIRTRDLTPLQVLLLLQYLDQQLGTDLFTALYEVPAADRDAQDALLQQYIYRDSDPSGPHIHAQVRKGREFPSTPRPV